MESWPYGQCYLNKFLRDRTEEVEAGLDLGLRVVSLDSGGNHRNEPSLGGHLNKTKVRNFSQNHMTLSRYLVSVGHHRDVDVAFSPDLLLRDDDLG